MLMLARFLAYVFLPVQILGCPTDGNWVAMKHVGKCYGGRLEILLFSYGEAEQMCRGQGAHLAMPRTGAEVKAIEAVALQRKLLKTQNKIWIGLDIIGMEYFNGTLTPPEFWYYSGLPEHWKWADGSVLLDNTRWIHTEGSQGPHRHCATMDISSGKFDTEQCWRRFPFFCERPDWLSDPTLQTQDLISNPALQPQRCPKGWTYFHCGELCYIVSDTKLPKNNDFCKKQQSQIAMPKTIRQHRAVLMMFIQGSESSSDFDDSEAWIGLTKTPLQYEWDDGTIETWISWGTSKPEKGEHCMSMNMNGLINIRSCSELKHIVCELPQIPGNLQRPYECGRTQRQQQRSKRNVPTRTRSKRNVPTRTRSKRNVPTRTRSKRNVPTRTRSKRNVPTRTNEVQPKVPMLNIGHIVGGQNASINNFPWSVRIRTITVGNCGGVLIGPKHVLTAAHCLTDEEISSFPFKELVLVGVSSPDTLYSSGKLERVHMVKIHPKYMPASKRQKAYQKGHAVYDIAIIELKRAIHVDCPKVRMACLPQIGPSEWGKETIYRLAGWGIGSGDTLKYCDIITKQVAETPNNPIFYHPVNKACYFMQGDSGSPLLCLDKSKNVPTWTVIGLVSSILFLSTNNTIPDYGSYVNVHHYKDWIKQHMQEDKRPDDRVYYETVCEGWVTDISCDYGRPPGIKVEKAFWGRQTDNVCNCREQNCTENVICTRDVTAFVTDRCDRRNRCRIVALSYLLNSSDCAGTQNYFQMEYKCTYPETLLARVCNFSGELLDMSCGRDNRLVIDVTKATYGRQSQSVCPTQEVTPHCSSDVTAVIAERCNGKVDCLKAIPMQLIANTECDGSENKNYYLEVNYRCNPESSLFTRCIPGEGRCSEQHEGSVCQPSLSQCVCPAGFHYQQDNDVCIAERGTECTPGTTVCEGDLVCIEEQNAGKTCQPKPTTDAPTPTTVTTTKTTKTTVTATAPIECYDGDGSSYVGTMHTTRKGLTCQRWDTKKPHPHWLTPKHFPDNKLPENYCRKVKGDSDPIWCFTTDPLVRFDLCDVPKCEEGKSSHTKDSSATTVSSSVMTMVWILTNISLFYWMYM